MLNSWVREKRPGSDTENEQQDECIKCGVDWTGGEKEPKWIQCELCRKWMHTKCTYLSKTLEKMTPEEIHVWSRSSPKKC